MPLPLFFHLVVILRKKLELVKLALSALPAPDSRLPHSSSRRLAPDLPFPPSLPRSASEACGGCFRPGEWIENASDLYTPPVQRAISSQAAEATSSRVTGQVIPR